MQMNEIVYSRRVRQFIGTYEEIESKRAELLTAAGTYLRMWPLDSDELWALEAWTARAEEYARAG